MLFIYIYIHIENNCTISDNIILYNSNIIQQGIIGISSHHDVILFFFIQQQLIYILLIKKYNTTI